MNETTNIPEDTTKSGIESNTLEEALVNSKDTTNSKIGDDTLQDNIIRNRIEEESRKNFKNPIPSISKFNPLLSNNQKLDQLVKNQNVIYNELITNGHGIIFYSIIFGIFLITSKCTGPSYDDVQRIQKSIQETGSYLFESNFQDCLNQQQLQNQLVELYALNSRKNYFKTHPLARKIECIEYKLD